MELLRFDAKMLVSTVALIGFVGLLVRLYNGLVAEPKRLRALLAKQGISGPPQALLLGNIKEIKKTHGGSIAKSPRSEPPTSHNLAATIFPFFDKWRKQFGIYSNTMLIIPNYHFILCSYLTRCDRSPLKLFFFSHI